MSELHNIQTFVKLDDVTTFNTVVAKFVDVLKNIGINNSELYMLLNSYEWQVEDNGFVYPPQPDYYITKYSSTEIRPLITGYTPKIDKSFKDNWVSIELLIRTEDIMDVAINTYKSGTFNLVRYLSLELHEQYKDCAVYFTDELQDGSDFDGLRIRNKRFLWQFDYALIPNNFDNLYSALPPGYTKKANKQSSEVYNANFRNSAIQKL